MASKKRIKWRVKLIRKLTSIKVGLEDEIDGPGGPGGPATPGIPLK